MTEIELCQGFINSLPDGWLAYPETHGWDILLVRPSDGFQIGIQAKLTLNAKVVTQAMEGQSYWHNEVDGPDCRAILIPHNKRKSDFATILDALGLVVISYADFGSYGVKLYPDLPKGPKSFADRNWYEFMPVSRHILPDYIPDVAAGSSAPKALTLWKVKAIKIQILLEKRGYVTRKDFKALEISMSRWTQNKWIKAGHEYGQWVLGNLRDLRLQHPVNFQQIEDDYTKWSNALESK